MKIPFTDQFLLDIYDFIEEIDKAFDPFGIRTIKEAYCPGLYKLRRRYERRKARKQFSNFVSYLKRKGYIKIKNLEAKQGVMLTKKGMEKVLKVKLRTRPRKKRRDKKWQMIIFDIPEKKRFLRDLLRENLRILDYKILQQSVWVCPYDVLKETEKIIRRYSLDNYVKLFLIEEI